MSTKNLLILGALAIGGYVVWKKLQPAPPPSPGQQLGQAVAGFGSALTSIVGSLTGQAAKASDNVGTLRL